MKLYNYIILLILIGGLAFLNGCSKKNNNPLQEETSFSMKVDGRTWNATLTSMMSDSHENSTWGKYHTLMINANLIIENNSASDDEDIETITFLVQIPDSKFRNPNGTYPITSSEEKLDNVFAVFGSTTDTQYSDQFIPISGTFEITNSKVGMPKVFGHETGKEGYTEVKGKFQLEMRSINGNKSIKITDGKFNIKNTLNIN